MKKRAFLPALILFFAAGLLQAQLPRTKVEEKVQKVMVKIDAAFNLSKATNAAVTEIFTDFYTAQSRIRENIQRPVSNLAQGFAKQDYQSVRRQNEKIIEERDARLKKNLTPEQYKKWIDDIEPSLRSKR